MSRALTLFMCVCVSTGFLFTGAGARAQTPASSEQPAAEEEETPVMRWVAAENAMIDPLSETDRQSLFFIRNKYSVIRAVRVVERDIEAAVKACGKENPGMEGRMSERFSQWREAVIPVLKTAESRVGTEIAHQTIVPADTLKTVLKLNDEAFVYGDEQVEKKPVTSEEACEKLLKSMDETEDKMLGLMSAVLLPASVLREKAARDLALSP